MIFSPLKVLLSLGSIKTNVPLYSVLFRGTRKWFNGVKTLNARTFPRKSHFKNKYQKLFPVFAGISNFEEVSMSENFLKILEVFFFCEHTVLMPENFWKNVKCGKMVPRGDFNTFTKQNEVNIVSK